jgi:hypothetical protein
MKKQLGAALAATLLLGVGTASAQLLSTRSSRFALVRAHCTTGPCNMDFTFSGGRAVFQRGKQPKLVTNRKLGKVRINGLTRLGAPPIPPTLEAEVSGTIFYGVDQNAVCPFANTVVSGPFASSTMNCTLDASGTAVCLGQLFFTDFYPAECSDVSQVIQDITIDVYLGSFVGSTNALIATAGINILGKSPDCASGGAGCP